MTQDNFKMKSINDLDDIEYSSASTRSSVSLSSDILQAAADLTTRTSSLLGIKSIGVDYGLVRTGLAVSVGYEPKALSIVSGLNNTQLANHVLRISSCEKASRIIVGLPFHKNGTEAEQTIITREFASHLNCLSYSQIGPGKMPIYLWDERYTSKEAAARMRAKNPRANLYKELDAEAACLILEYYYLDNGLGAQLVELPVNKSIRNAVEHAWLLKKQEMEKNHQELTDLRMMNSKQSKRAMIERANFLDEKLAMNRGKYSRRGGKKKGKRNSDRPM